MKINFYPLRDPDTGVRTLGQLVDNVPVMEVSWEDETANSDSASYVGMLDLIDRINLEFSADCVTYPDAVSKRLLVQYLQECGTDAVFSAQACMHRQEDRMVCDYMEAVGTGCLCWGAAALMSNWMYENTDRLREQHPDGWFSDDGIEYLSRIMLAYLMTSEFQIDENWQIVVS